MITAYGTVERTRQCERMNAMLSHAAKPHSRCNYAQTELAVNAEL